MPRTRRRTLFRAAALVVMLAIAEGLSAFTAAVISYPRIRRASTLYSEQSEQIRALLDTSEAHHTEIHPVLGWRHAPNFHGGLNLMNSAALRARREYAPVPPAGVLRVAVFGDSYVYGAEVDNDRCWAGRIERENPDIEVLNYGVSGYGVDQAYLRYLLEGRAFSPRLVVMGFVPDDINRAVNVYRRFLSPGAALFKPRYVLGPDGELSLVAAPFKGRADYERVLARPQEITRIGSRDYWYPACVYENPLHDYSATLRLACAAGGQLYRRYLDPDRPIKGGMFNEHSSAFKIQVALFRAFFAAARERGAVPLIVMLPDQKAVLRARRGEPTVYQPLLDYMRAHGLSYVDASDALSTTTENDVMPLFAEGGHYSTRGNQLVASWLASRLRRAAASGGGTVEQSRFEPPSQSSVPSTPARGRP